MTVATVLTVYGIETYVHILEYEFRGLDGVATVLTVYGIETYKTVEHLEPYLFQLQQYLPFTVLKQYSLVNKNIFFILVATVLTVYGIETSLE